MQTHPFVSLLRFQLAAAPAAALAPARTIALTLGAVPLASIAAAQGADLVIPTGSTIVYNTATGNVLNLNSLVVERDARFVVIGPAPLRLNAALVQIDGLFSASGAPSSGVGGLNTTNIPELGAPGSAGGGAGGTGSSLTDASTPAGLPGEEAYSLVIPGVPLGGGRGGETSFAPPGPDWTERRRGAGGGGGALAADQPVAADPFDEANLGLIAFAGMDGGPDGFGALSGTDRARGGLPGLPIFQDANPDNDYWGMKLDGGTVRLGELRRPVAGRGGGGGGDAVGFATFPRDPFSPVGDEKGAGGGGGGGLVIIVARTFQMGSEGRLSANGGAGGAGENVVFFDRVGGGSGGGSGGWIVVDAGMIDLSAASDEAISALGGVGGAGRFDRIPQGPFGSDIPGAGGAGGPGVIQLHVPSGLEADILLPAGKAVGDLTQPDAHVLLPVLGG